MPCFLPRCSNAGWTELLEPRLLLGFIWRYCIDNIFCLYCFDNIVKMIFLWLRDWIMIILLQNLNRSFWDNFLQILAKDDWVSTYCAQVNLFQKHLFLHQLTHNMAKDCSLNYKFSTWKFQAQNMLCT